MDKIAVLIPCYNESATIAKVVKDYRAALPEAAIYVYDNNSTDGTDEIARAAGAVVRYERRQGKGNVIRTMFREIDAECYLMIDGDDTYPAEDARAMASSILSDIMARLNNYRYEYKKMNYIEKPDYTTDITLKIYARYKETDVQGILNFSKIHEQFISEESNYVIGEIPLRELLEKRSQLSGRDVFLANIPIFFLNRD